VFISFLQYQIETMAYHAVRSCTQSLASPRHRGLATRRRHLIRRAWMPDRHGRAGELRQVHARLLILHSTPVPVVDLMSKAQACHGLQYPRSHNRVHVKNAWHSSCSSSIWIYATWSYSALPSADISLIHLTPGYLS